MKYISINQNEVNTIYVASAGKIRINRNDLKSRNNMWVPIKKEVTSIYLNKYKITSPAINRTQFPLMLSWTCTVHKVQDLSLNSAVISLDLENKNCSIKDRCMLLLAM